MARIPGLHPCCEWYMQNRFNRVRLFSTLWTVAHQAPLSMEFSRKEYWSGLPFPTPGDLSDPGIESRYQSPALQTVSLLCEPPGKSPSSSYEGTNPIMSPSTPAPTSDLI